MADKPQELLENLAEQSADLDDIIERNETSHRQRFIELQTMPEERDPVIWQDAFNTLLGTLSPLPFEDWFLMDAEEYAAMDDEPMKAVMWQASVAASKAQADLEVIRQVIQEAEGHSLKNAEIVKDLSKEQLQDAAKEGIGNIRFNNAKERRKNGN